MYIVKLFWKKKRNRLPADFKLEVSRTVRVRLWCAIVQCDSCERFSERLCVL